MKTLIKAVGLVAVLCIAPMAIAEEEESPTLGVTLDSTFVSKYMWRGYDILGDHGAWQPSVDLDLFGTGFSLNV